ncbi:flagellin [Vibrio methylphosphonaticus]|uniref:flagellin n=1 Tax=Vibrio methylphosphonaticus TaxID=2946866 RepID=UPI00202A1600|nr:flagellin [Vibrio methylphosphonaticus]MCL9776519.1 flagellin [Vibrio methylphosphonaticus]
MAVSTVEVRPHSIKLSGQETTNIAPSQASEPSTSLSKRYLTPQANMAPTSYSLSGILLTQGQQQATSVQIASKTLQTVGRELTQVKRTLTQALTHGVSDAMTASLSRSKQGIESTLDNARFDDKRVVDNELKLKLNSADVRHFSIPGLNIGRMSERSEQVRLDFPGHGTVIMQFDGQMDTQSNHDSTVKKLDRSLIPMGMRASLSQDGNIVFQAQESAYIAMQQQVKVTGQGHRFPAGQANTFTVKAEPDGIAELRFDLGSREGIKQSIATVNQHLQQAQSSLQESKHFQSQLNSQMSQLQSQSNLPSATQVNGSLAQFSQQSNDFTSTFRALNAQANVRRHTVVALLK